MVWATTGAPSAISTATLIDSLSHAGAAATRPDSSVRPRLFELELVLNVMLRAVTGDRDRRADVREHVRGDVHGDFFPALTAYVASMPRYGVFTHARRDTFVGGLVDDGATPVLMAVTTRRRKASLMKD
nr:unnamed protein product [Digitaria exilis]